MFFRKNIKNKGLTLVETVVSLWILGIVILSMLTFTGATMSKKNQFRIQAITIAKSELQDAMVSLQYDRQSNEIGSDLSIDNYNFANVDHITIYLLKSSYLTTVNIERTREENKIIERTTEVVDNLGTDNLFTKYVIYKTNGQESFGSESFKVDKNSIPLSNIYEHYKLNEKIKTDMKSNRSGSVIDYETLKSLLFSDTDDYGTQKQKYDTYLNLMGLLQEGKSASEKDGTRAFIVLTEYGKQCTSEQLYEPKVIPINIKVLWASEKKKDGIYPLAIYDIASEIIIGADSDIYK